jgi:hypothetical protein
MAAPNLEKGLSTSESRVNQRFHCITDRRAQPRGAFAARAVSRFRKYFPTTERNINLKSSTRAMTLRPRWPAHAIHEPTKAKTPSLWSRWFRSRVLRKLALLRDNILGSTLGPFLYDFIDLRSTHDQSGRLHRSSAAGSSRRGAAGFRLVQKMAAPNKKAEEGWGRR